MVWGGSFPGQRRSSSNQRRSIPASSQQRSNNTTTNNHHYGSVLQNSNNTNHQVVAAGDSVITEEEATLFLRQAQALIPAEIRMISGCEDEQTSADVTKIVAVSSSSNHNNSILPNPAGRAGGACTSALLKVLYEHHHQQSQQQRQEPLSFQQALISLRQELANQGFSQIPQLTSSRPLDVGQTPFTLVGNNNAVIGGGQRRRALLVGINYIGQDGQLRGCHNDVLNVKNYICQIHDFPEHDVLILMDDDTGQQYEYPTRENIVRALQKLVAFSQPGDAVFFHYSGHGGLLLPIQNYFKAQSKAYDQTLIPVDHSSAGQIRDFSLFNHFVKPMKAGVTVTCWMDCCHSGSVLDLPYTFRATKQGDYDTSTRSSMMTTASLAHLSNLCFLYTLAGGILPSDLFSGVTQHINNTLGDDVDLSDYQGAMAEDAQQDDYENILSTSDPPTGGDYYNAGNDDGGGDYTASSPIDGDYGDYDGGDDTGEGAVPEPGYDAGVFQQANNMAGDDFGDGGVETCGDGCGVFGGISGLLGSIFNNGDAFLNADGDSGGFFDASGDDGGFFADGGDGDFGDI